MIAAAARSCRWRRRSGVPDCWGSPSRPCLAILGALFARHLERGGISTFADCAGRRRAAGVTGARRRAYPAPAQAPWPHASDLGDHVDAPPDTVWNQVVSFADLPPPTEWELRRRRSSAARAHRRPRRGRDPALRVLDRRLCRTDHRVGSTASVLAFDVSEQPPGLRELSPTTTSMRPTSPVTCSKRGEFRLRALPNGRTHLEGSTFYELDVFPGWDRLPFADAIIGRIHQRVLRHIKGLAGSGGAGPPALRRALAHHPELAFAVSTICCLDASHRLPARCRRNRFPSGSRWRSASSRSDSGPAVRFGWPGFGDEPADDRIRSVGGSLSPGCGERNAARPVRSDRAVDGRRRRGADRSPARRSRAPAGAVHDLGRRRRRFAGCRRRRPGYRAEMSHVARLVRRRSNRHHGALADAARADAGALRRPGSFCTEGVARFLASRIPGARLACIRDGDHALAHDRADEVASLIRAHLVV